MPVAIVGRIPIDELEDPEQPVRTVDVAGVPYGLELVGDKLYAAVSQRGIVCIDAAFEHDSGETAVKTVTAANESAYRILIDPQSGRVLSGSTGGRICGPWTNSKTLGRSAHVSALASLGSGAILVGTLGGTLAVSFEDGMTALLAVGEAGIWSLLVDEQHEQVLVASGDGVIRALERPAPMPSPPSDRPPLELKVRADVDAVRSCSELQRLQVLQQLTMRRQDLSDDQVRLVRDLGEGLEIGAGFGDDVAQLLFGWSALRLGEFDEAVSRLQSIASNSPLYVEATLLLAEAFEGAGQPTSAVRVLQNNLNVMSADAQADALTLMARLHESRGDYDTALICAEEASSLRSASEDLRELLSRVRRKATAAAGSLAPDSLDDGPQGLSVSVRDTARNPSLQPQEGVLSKRRSDSYDLVTYIHYEYGPPGDEAKKLLEADLIHPIVEDLSARADTLTALDIGCATGRWPLWIARRGFEAHGYDISDAAIAICDSHRERYPELNLTFSVHDIAESVPVPNYFSLVTSMMGTFTHVPEGRRHDFLSNVRKSLRPDGVFVFTIWNAASRFCEFLALDGEAAKESLRANHLDEGEVRDLLGEAGLVLDELIPFCFLPNACYESWEHDLRIAGDVADIDRQLRAKLESRRAQMFMCVASLPREEDSQ